MSKHNKLTKTARIRNLRERILQLEHALKRCVVLADKHAVTVYAVGILNDKTVTEYGIADTPLPTWPTPRSFERGISMLDEYGQASKKVKRASARQLSRDVIVGVMPDRGKSAAIKTVAAATGMKLQELKMKRTPRLNTKKSYVLVMCTATNGASLHGMADKLGIKITAVRALIQDLRRDGHEIARISRGMYALRPV